MSDPRRLIDPGGDASAFVRELLRDAPPPHAIHSAARARGSAFVTHLAATPAPVVATVTWIKGFLVVAGVGLAGLGGVILRAPRRPAVVAQRVATAKPPSPAPLATASTFASEPDEARAQTMTETPELAAHGEGRRGRSHTRRHHRAQAEAAPPAATPAPATTPAEDPLDRERRLLDAAQSALPGDPQQALQRLATYDAEFPNGQLRAEREVVAVDALQRLGRIDDARARGEALAARHPGYARRVRRILERSP